jgi:hypothetical protein
MSKELTIHRNYSKFKNEIELIDKVLSIYTIIKYEVKSNLETMRKIFLFIMSAKE